MKAAITLALSVLITATALAQKDNARLQPSCGERKIHLDVKAEKAGADTSAEAGKPQLYVIEIAEPAFLFDPHKITIRIGLDGEWVGAVKGQIRTWRLRSPPVNTTSVLNASPFKQAWNERPDPSASPRNRTNGTTSALNSKNTRG